ncbi:MAG: hypothetical protein HQL73_03410 [Magnetococcales bacterium]|nr:hypothetical protein [Magnetococcales bacterium]
MMPARFNHLSLARVCLQNRSGLSIASGLSEGSFDVLLVRDANGLPTLPGTAVAGVLRHLYQKAFSVNEAEALFGTQSGEHESTSRIQFSWGAVHDSSNNPVEGLLLGEDAKKLEQDPVLRLLCEAQPVLRDHVRINHRGTADGSGKFDRGTLPPGCRFTLEVALWSERDDDPCWKQVLALFFSPLFRLGGAVRRGLGALDVVSIHEIHFNLKDPKQFKQFHGLHRAMGSKDGWHRLKKDPLLRESRTPEVSGSVPPESAVQYLSLKMTLKPMDFWRFGQGEESLDQASEKRIADQLPLGIPKITWTEDGLAQMMEQTILIPASAIKGALVHRFVFHLLRFEGRFLEDLENPEKYDPRSHKAVQALFGFAQDGSDHESSGAAGRLLMDDLARDLPPQTPGQWLGRLTHNSQDRFTAGVRDGALFTEEMLFDLSWPLTIYIIDPYCAALQDPNLKKALAEVLEDLAQGRLALGAGETKGHGIFTSEKVSWSDGGLWIGELNS